MQKKKIILSLPKEWIGKLEKTRKETYLTSIQEVIYNLIRKEYFTKKTSFGRRGRPEKKTFEDYFSTPTKETRKLEREGLI